MKTNITISLFCLFLLLSLKNNSFAQFGHALEEPDSAKFGGSAFVGAITADGINYQQIGARLDVPIGKLGFGLDVQLLIDANGKIRKEDWDDFGDYIDKIYYIRWAKKGDPLYFRAGGLNFTYLGFSNVVNGYSNMVEYPTNKRYGFEMAVNREKFNGEFFFNDVKELFSSKGSMLLGGRVAYKVLGNLSVGGTLATDLNEYNGLKDRDDDGYPDVIDFYPDEKKWVTKYDRRLSETHDTVYIEKAVAYGDISPTRKDSLFNKYDDRSSSAIISFDVSYPLIDREKLNLTVYSHYTKIAGYGSGIAFPGVQLKVGQGLTISAEYRRQTKEFLFGYYNQTYELERSFFRLDEDSIYQVVTKKESLELINKGLQGIYVGADLRFLIFDTGIHYQDMFSDGINRRSVHGEFGLNATLIPGVKSAKAYYMQNNVENFKHWKTPSTIAGFIVEYNFKGAVFGVEYRYTFLDNNGDGVIKGSNETIKNINFRTSILF